MKDNKYSNSAVFWPFWLITKIVGSVHRLIDVNFWRLIDKKFSTPVGNPPYWPDGGSAWGWRWVRRWLGRTCCGQVECACCSAGTGGETVVPRRWTTTAFWSAALLYRAAVRPSRTTTHLQHGAKIYSTAAAAAAAAATTTSTTTTIHRVTVT